MSDTTSSTVVEPSSPLPPPTISLTSKQSIGIELFMRWFAQELERKQEEGDDYIPGIFRIFGYAGVGKTFFTKYAIKKLQESLKRYIRVHYSAFSGKACLVMERNGMAARTIHSTIYKVVTPDKEHALELQKQIKAALDNDERKRLDKELKEAESLGFILNEDDDAPLRGADLYVLDECSMVNEEMLNDILSFKVPLLVLGDPGQLPPVEGTGALMNEKPNVFLDEVMRQAADNPIIQLSMMARHGSFLPKRTWGDKAKHVSHFDMTNEEMKTADQILVGKNATRTVINKRVRSLLGREGRYPVVGDKLICLKNNRELGIYNGLICTVVKQLDEYDLSIMYELEDETGRKFTTKVLRLHFDEYFTPGVVKNAKWWDKKGADEFDYGYAITVHKSQGSQWDKVILWDDKFFVWDKEQRKKWLYTAITRSADTLIIAS